MMSNNKQQRARAVFAKKSSVIATEIALALMAAQIAYAQQPPEQAAPPQQPPEQAAPQQQPAAPAQPAAQPARTAEQIERIEITGTRIPQVNVEGPSPITTLSAQDIKMDGHAKAEDLLNQLPQVYTSQGSNSSNGATGTANVNLRNLGPTRNLVLINGRRLPPGSPRSGSDSYAADLNQIPAPLIQRVELLTGGASAVYGSDAISGVVNFIMNDRFEGLQIDAKRSFYNHQQHNSTVSDVVSARAQTNPSQFQVPGNVGADGAINDFSLLMGRNFADNRGNATLFFNYKREDAVLQGTRDFSACSLNPGNSFACGGSSTSYPGRFFMGGTGASFTVADAAGTTRPFSAATDQFNFGPYNYYRRPSEQWAFSAFTHMDIVPKVRAYSEFQFHDNHTVAQIAPSGIFFGSPDFFGPNAIHFENPLLGAGPGSWRSTIAANNGGAPFAANGDRADMLIGRRNLEGGGRQDDIRHSSYRGVLGIKGEMFPNWNYDVYGQAGKVLYSGVYRNDFSKTRILRAMDVVPNGFGGLSTGRVGANVPVCRSETTGLDPNCRPYDIWRLGGVTQDALDYLQTPGLQNGYTSQTVVSGTASSDLGAYGVKLPLAKNGVGVVVGVEQRKEKLSLETDTSFSTFDLAGQGGPTIGVNGSLDVSEYFGEVRVPLIEGRVAADLLSVSASYRYSDYSTKKKTNTYGLGTEWAPVRDYRLRGSYQHAVRHANVVELFQPQGNNLFGMDSDPCGASPTATFAQCQRSGITTIYDPVTNPTGQYGNPILNSPAGQFNFLQGGNIDLKPETADSYTLGLVFTPIKNITGSIDWWLIKVDDVISNAPPSSLLTACLNNNQFCNLINRDSLGTLWALPSGRIVAINDNLGGYNTSGIDFGVNYAYPLEGLGSVAFNYLGT